MQQFSVKGLYDRGVGSGPAGPVLAGLLFIKVKTKFNFAKSSLTCSPSTIHTVCMWLMKHAGSYEGHDRYDYI